MVVLLLHLLQLTMTLWVQKSICQVDVRCRQTQKQVPGLWPILQSTKAPPRENRPCAGLHQVLVSYIITYIITLISFILSRWNSPLKTITNHVTTLWHHLEHKHLVSHLIFNLILSNTVYLTSIHFTRGSMTSGVLQTTLFQCSPQLWRLKMTRKRLPQLKYNQTLIPTSGSRNRKIEWFHTQTVHLWVPLSNGSLWLTRYVSPLYLPVFDSNCIMYVAYSSARAP